MRVLLTAMMVFSSAAGAQGVCSAGALSSELQYLRRLTLDLAGRAPTEAELQAVLDTSHVDPATIDRLLQPASVKPQLRRLVRQLLQANLQLPLQNAGNLSRTTLGDGQGFPTSPALWVINRAQTYRKRPDGTSPTQQPCFDEPAQFDPQGKPIAVLRSDGYLREGWVMVHPYWDPDPHAQVRVCAFDAQSAETAQVHGRTMRCDQHDTVYQSADCGCGPELRLCQGGAPYTESVINAAMVEQVLRMVDRIVDERRPWSDLLIGRTLEVNGPLAHYLRYQTGLTTEFSSRGDVGYQVPAIPYTDSRWYPVTLGGRSSGLLTSPFYLLKFASNRSRANQFFNAFTCTSLQASSAGLPNEADAGFEPNLALRTGCKDCHQLLEPAAASWGRYVERGTWELKDAEFPTSNPACISPDGGPVLSEACNTHYRTIARHVSEVPFVGQLTGRLYLEAEGQANFDVGPSRWATRVVNEGTFAECTVHKLWQSFLGRAFVRSLADEDQMLIGLKADFRTNHDIVALMRAIVTSRQYRESERPIGGTQ